MSIETRALSTVDGTGKGPTARSISYAPSPYITATNVQAAIDSLGVNYALVQSYAQSASASAATATSAATSCQGYATAAAASAGTAATQASSASASAATATSQASAAASSAAAAASYLLAWTGTSSSSVAIGTGTKTFGASTGKVWAVGTPLLISSNANTNNYMFGIVTGYVSDTGILTVEVTNAGGSGTHSDWNISLSGQKGVDGLGAGDVIGPGTNRDGWIPTWNLANSKRLADGIDPSTLLSNSNTTAAGRALVNSTVTANGSGDVSGVTKVIVNNTTVAGTQSSYGISTGVSGAVDLALGAGASYAYIQSWNSKPLYINNQGNNVLFGPGNVGIGAASPSKLLELEINNALNGIRIASSSAGSGATPVFEGISYRADANDSFSTRFAAAHRRSDGTAIASGAKLGSVLFGGQYGTDTTFQASKLLYAASIKGVAEGNFTSSGAMPTGIAFYTGSVGEDVYGVNKTYGTERLRIDYSGNVGIGASPSAHLHNITSTRLAHLGSGTVTSDASGNLSVSSDERLKDIDGDFTRSIEAIRLIAPKLYHWNERSGMDRFNQYAGLSAQNVQAAVPEAVGVDSEGFLTLSDRTLIATLINAVKNIDQRLTAAGF